MAIVTLRNDFHNTTVRIRCETLSHIHNEVTIYPSKDQLKRAARTLCCISDCTCGGIRGRQEHNGKRLIVDYSNSR